MEEIKDGQLKVWWTPQVPMKSFNVFVKDIYEAKKIIDVLADYDMFQYKNNIKPDYCSTGGLAVWDDILEPDESGEKWTDWHDEETDYDIDDYFRYVVNVT